MTEEEILRLAMEILHRRVAPAATPSLTLRQLYGHYERSHKRQPGWQMVALRLAAVMDSAYADGSLPLGDRDVMSLRVLDWSDYREHRETVEYAPGKKYSAHTINLELQALKALLNYSVREGRITHNPIAAAKGKGTRPKRTTVPAEVDISRLLEESDPRLRYVILAANDAGMRRNEIRLCQRGWVDVAAKKIRLSAEVCKGNKARTVPATRRLLDAIGALPQHFRAPWILTNPNTGEPFGNDTLSKWFRRIADYTGLRPAPGDGRVVLHDGRHGFATKSSDRGVKLPIIQKQMGHANIATTMIYISVSEEGYGEASAAFEAGIKSDQEKTRDSSPSEGKGKP